ncbi:DUF2157 domain-containing protein [Sporosarcina sp. E16_8]|uniref:DUF2157 domain-containing protein n=1 Tax=Sporosarcina sp. E16_8 TaxID=2789295 RepID=UPI001A91F430|nr:DUF2157 domain-containing protein [Sporosarcina sp. E16_8]MBO0588142.1 DUF2157 domain-containing protein [Sporosarcina sp. E16_8]
MKRKISNSEYRVLEKEFIFLEHTGQLQTNQARKLLAEYVPTERLSFVRVLLIIGAVLIGVGILSFIAGNWHQIPKLAKFLLLFFGTASFYASGYKIEDDYPRTSRSLYYIGVFAFGAGIFLISQMFNLGEGVYADFFMWGLGILPLAYYLKDKLIFASASLFFIIYGFNVLNGTVEVPYLLLLIIPLLFWMNEKRMGHSRGLFIANSILTLLFLFNLFIYFDVHGVLISCTFFALGLFLAFYPFGRYQLPSEWLGSAVYGIAGLYLTFPSTWIDFVSEDNTGIAAIIFTLIFAVKLLFFLKIGSLPAVLIVCTLIFRFYADLSYNFMPKSLFFIVGGLILIGFGFWFEKTRRGTVISDEHDEK